MSSKKIVLGMRMREVASTMAQIHPVIFILLFTAELLSSILRDAEQVVSPASGQEWSG